MDKFEKKWSQGTENWYIAARDGIFYESEKNEQISLHVFGRNHCVMHHTVHYVHHTSYSLQVTSSTYIYLSLRGCTDIL